MSSRKKVLLYDVRQDNQVEINQQRVLHSAVATFYCDKNSYDDLTFFRDLTKGSYSTGEYDAIITTRIANELNAKPFDEHYFAEYNIHPQRGYVAKGLLFNSCCLRASAAVKKDSPSSGTVLGFSGLTLGWWRRVRSTGTASWKRFSPCQT